jgi:hypothetical protein
MAVALQVYREATVDQLVPNACWGCRFSIPTTYEPLDEMYVPNDVKASYTVSGQSQSNQGHHANPQEAMES